MDCDPIESISILNVLGQNEFQLVDVRETHELPRIEDFNVLTIPLCELEDNLHHFNQNVNYYFFCQTGKRSIKAIELLRQYNYNNCHSLQEGANELNEIFIEKEAKLK